MHSAETMKLYVRVTSLVELHHFHLRLTAFMVGN